MEKPKATTQELKKGPRIFSHLPPSCYSISRVFFPRENTSHEGVGAPRGAAQPVLMGRGGLGSSPATHIPGGLCPALPQSSSPSLDGSIRQTLFEPLWCVLRALGASETCKAARPFQELPGLSRSSKGGDGECGIDSKAMKTPGDRRTSRKPVSGPGRMGFQ